MSDISAADSQFISAFISASEFRVLERKFNEYSNSKEIHFDDFREILSSNNRIAKEILSPFLEKVKKKLKDDGNTEKENLSNISNIFKKLFQKKIFLLFIAKQEYFYYINLLVIENNKYLNERDPELSTKN